jgi:predicted dehydrogenase
MRAPEVNWRFNARRGGGAVYDLACYCIHHARFVVGDEPERVYASGRPQRGSGVEESVAATMEFPGGRTAQWWVSFGDQPSQEVEVFGPRGRLRIGQAWNNEDQPTALEVVEGAAPAEQIVFEPVFQFALQLQHLCDCLRTGQPHRIPPADSLAQMRVVDAVYESMRTGAPASVASDRVPARR